MFIGKYINDERILSIKQKIQSEAFIMLVYLLLGEILVKRLIFNYSIEIVYLDIGIMMFACYYVIIKTVIKGAYALKQKAGDTKRKKYIRSSLYSLLGCVAGTVIIGIIDYFINGNAFSVIVSKVWPVFTIFPVAIAAVYILLDVISQKIAVKNINK
jgi:hypothetical protein